MSVRGFLVISSLSCSITLLACGSAEAQRSPGEPYILQPGKILLDGKEDLDLENLLESASTDGHFFRKLLGDAAYSGAVQAGAEVAGVVAGNEVPEYFLVNPNVKTLAGPKFRITAWLAAPDANNRLQKVKDYSIEDADLETLIHRFWDAVDSPVPSRVEVLPRHPSSQSSEEIVSFDHSVMLSAKGRIFVTENGPEVNGVRSSGWTTLRKFNKSNSRYDQVTVSAAHDRETSYHAQSGLYIATWTTSHRPGERLTIDVQKVRYEDPQTLSNPVCESTRVITTDDIAGKLPARTGTLCDLRFLQSPGGNQHLLTGFGAAQDSSSFFCFSFEWSENVEHKELAENESVPEGFERVPGNERYAQKITTGFRSLNHQRLGRGELEKVLGSRSADDWKSLVVRIHPESKYWVCAAGNVISLVPNQRRPTMHVVIDGQIQPAAFESGYNLSFDPEVLSKVIRMNLGDRRVTDIEFSNNGEVVGFTTVSSAGQHEAILWDYLADAESRDITLDPLTDAERTMGASVVTGQKSPFAGIVFERDNWIMGLTRPDGEFELWFYHVDAEHRNRITSELFSDGIHKKQVRSSRRFPIMFSSHWLAVPTDKGIEHFKLLSRSELLTF